MKMIVIQLLSFNLKIDLFLRNKRFFNFSTCGLWLSIINAFKAFISNNKFFRNRPTSNRLEIILRVNIFKWDHFKNAVHHFSKTIIIKSNVSIEYQELWEKTNFNQTYSMVRFFSKIQRQMSFCIDPFFSLL